jgi:Ca2+-binding RTX toxin-like protein
MLVTADEGGTTALNLTGNERSQTIWGNNGANRIDGGNGSDVLRGLGGADTFVFSSGLGPGNVDQILDFQAGVDRIAIDDNVFANMGVGNLNAGAFRTGKVAQDADDRILYDPGTGALLFDFDGAGGAAAVQFATLQAGLSLSASDFQVI